MKNEGIKTDNRQKLTVSQQSALINIQENILIQ